LKYQVLLSILIFIFILTISGTVVAANNTTDLVSISSNGSMSDGYSLEPSISADGRYVAFTSYADNLVPNDTDDINGYADIFVHDKLLNITTKVSVSYIGGQANGDSFNPSISADGRYVAYNSYASNLVVNDINGCDDVFVRDMILNTTTLISKPNNIEQGDGDSFNPSISADGRYVAFTSTSDNLVVGDNNGCSDIFVFDQTLNTIKRISVSSTGEEGDSDSSEPSISGNGCSIAFNSNADNLVSNDNNGCSDIFVFDQTLNTIKRISVSSTGEEGDSDSSEPSISGDGQYIAFTSDADNLIVNDTNGFSDVFVYNQNSCTTERVSLQNTGEEIDEDSSNPSISSDGNYVAFVVGAPIRPGLISDALNSVNSNFNNINNVNTEEEYYNYHFIYVHDMITGITNKVSVSSTGEDADSSCDDPSINADGSIITFSSYADNLISNDSNYCSNIFVHTDNNINSFSGSIIPSNVKSGDSVNIKAYSENATSITALILNKTLNLTKQSNGGWSLNYIIPYNISDGIYSALLTATDTEGNLETLSLNFTLNNTPPVVSGTITPNIVKSEDEVEIDAYSDPNVASIWASICGDNLKMNNNQDGTWTVFYYLPDLVDGNYPVILTATDKEGNHGTTSLNFTVNNDAPVISGYLTPNTVKTFDNITITANSDPNTTTITALILNQIYNLTKQTDSTWNLQYTTPYVPDGNYPILLTATNNVGNTGTNSLNFNVFNPIDNIPPIVTGNITPNPLYAVNDYFPPDCTSLTIKAFSDPDTVNITALLHYHIYNMIRQEDGSWILNIPIGNHDGFDPSSTVVLTATDWSGNQGTTSIEFNVIDLHPIISATVTPNTIAKSGDVVIISVSSDLNAQKVWLGTNYFIKQADGTWELNYTVPNIPNGIYQPWIYLSYNFGNGDISDFTPVDITIDNTPPNISGSATPNPIISGHTLKITASTDNIYEGYFYYMDPNNPGRLCDFLGGNVENLTATILGQTYNVTKLDDWGYSSGNDWSMDYIIPNIPDGTYPIILTATDPVGITKTISLNFTVDNTPPVITATLNPDTLIFIDTNDRSIIITAQSSPDTKTVYACSNMDNQEGYLNVLNGNWTLDLSVS
jgi:Tol biopolymer transport system component